MTKPTVSPAVRRALAYAYATGRLPKGVHGSTYCAAVGLLEGRVSNERPVSEVLDIVRADPLAKAHDYLIARGWKVDKSGRSFVRQTSHYISYRRDDSLDEALASRCGGVVLIKVNDARPYRVSTNISAEAVAADV